MCNEFLMFVTTFFISQGFITKVMDNLSTLGKWTITAIYGHQVFKLLIALFILCVIKSLILPKRRATNKSLVAQPFSTQNLYPFHSFIDVVLGVNHFKGCIDD